MNNSKFALDNVFEEPEFDRTPVLRERESELVKVIEALEVIASSKEWSTLKNTVFDGVVETLEKQLTSEAKKDTPELQVLARINGQLIWAKKYADLNKLSTAFRLELTNIRQQLYGQTPQEPGIL